MVQQGIEKLNILTVLQEEQILINSILSMQEKHSQKIDQCQSYPFYKDVNNMRNMSKRLDRKIMNLEKDIRTLQLKAKPFNPIPGVPSYVVDYPSKNGNGFDELYEDDDEDEDEKLDSKIDVSSKSISRCSTPESEIDFIE